MHIYHQLYVQSNYKEAQWDYKTTLEWQVQLWKNIYNQYINPD
jgi:hypothetical protein